jgi:hypothetical protein
VSATSPRFSSILASSLVALGLRASRFVVRQRLLVGVERARRVGRGLEVIQRLHAVGRERAHVELDLDAELRRAAEVLGEQRDDLVGALACALLDEACDLVVLVGADALGQHPVGDVADQHVLERELGLAGQHTALAADDQVLGTQRG